MKPKPFSDTIFLIDPTGILNSSRQNTQNNQPFPRRGHKVYLVPMANTGATSMPDYSNLLRRKK